MRYGFSSMFTECSTEELGGRQSSGSRGARDHGVHGVQFTGAPCSRLVALSWVGGKREVIIMRGTDEVPRFMVTATFPVIIHKWPFARKTRSSWNGKNAQTSHMASLRRTVPISPEEEPSEPLSGLSYHLGMRRTRHEYNGFSERLSFMNVSLSVYR